MSSDSASALFLIKGVSIEKAFEVIICGLQIP
jgi:hypothetical protein